MRARAVARALVAAPPEPERELLDFAGDRAQRLALDVLDRHHGVDQRRAPRRELGALRSRERRGIGDSGCSFGHAPVTCP